MLFRPAGYVSGDIYDVMKLDDRHIGFFLADAVGHGVPAALLTMYIKRSLVTKQVSSSGDGGHEMVLPDEVLRRLNQDMTRRRGGKTYCATACYGVIDCETLEVSVARAGHPLPMVLRADGSAELMESDGLMLGVLPEARFSLARARLGRGDRVLLYSDGFELVFRGGGNDAPTSSRNALETRYGLEFRDLARGPLGGAIRRLSEKLDQESGSLNQRDDLTVLCIGVRAEDGERDGLGDARGFVREFLGGEGGRVGVHVEGR
jgi:serine phosphatase RsbU (regulator of sigma subunit)